MKCEACGHINKATTPYVVNGVVYGCECPSHLREETKSLGDEKFLPQTGCLNCNRWDEPPVLRGDKQ